MVINKTSAEQVLEIYNLAQFLTNKRMDRFNLTPFTPVELERMHRELFSDIIDFYAQPEPR